MKLIASHGTCPICGGDLRVEEAVSTQSRHVALDIGCVDCSATFGHISSDYDGLEVEFLHFEDRFDTANRMIELRKAAE